MTEHWVLSEMHVHEPYPDVLYASLPMSPRGPLLVDTGGCFVSMGQLWPLARFSSWASEAAAWAAVDLLLVGARGKNAAFNKITLVTCEPAVTLLRVAPGTILGVDTTTYWAPRQASLSWRLL